MQDQGVQVKKNLDGISLFPRLLAPIDNNMQSINIPADTRRRKYRMP
jgi:hypothetical protein